MTISTLRMGFATFDALANRGQMAYLTLLNMLFCFSWLAVIFLQFCSISIRNVYTVYGYLACLGIAWVCFIVAQVRRHQLRHIDYRAIAESLRVQFFWRACGIQEEVADRYLATHGSVLPWMRSVVSTITFIADARRSGERAPATWPELRAVDVAWLQDQEKYFSAAAKRDQEALRLRRLVITVCFFFGSVLTIAYVLNGFPRSLALLVGVLMASGAVLAGHTETLALEEHANQYTQMAALYQAARNAFARSVVADDISSAIRVLYETGHEAVGDAMAWMVLHKTRPIRPPK